MYPSAHLGDRSKGADQMERGVCWPGIRAVTPSCYRPASARVISPAGTARQPLTFWPAHSGEKSSRPARSASRRSAYTSVAASGKGGAASVSARPRAPGGSPGASRAAGEHVRQRVGVPPRRGPGPPGGRAAWPPGRAGTRCRLHPARAQGQRGRDPARVGDAAGGDHRHAHRVERFAAPVPGCRVACQSVGAGKSRDDRRPRAPAR